jgi:thioredoxin 1
MVALPSSLFELIEKSDKPVLVDFYANWCGPCKMMAPVVSEVAKRFKDKLLVVKVDVDQKNRIAAYYNVQAVPTFILFSRGEILWKLEGALPAQRFVQAISEQIQKISL